MSIIFVLVASRRIREWCGLLIMAHHLCCVLRRPSHISGLQINLGSCLLQCVVSIRSFIGSSFAWLAWLVWFLVCFTLVIFVPNTASLFLLNSAWCVSKGQRIFDEERIAVYYFILGSNVILVDGVLLCPSLFFGFLLDQGIWDVLERAVAYLLAIGL